MKNSLAERGTLDSDSQSFADYAKGPSGLGKVCLKHLLPGDPSAKKHLDGAAMTRLLTGVQGLCFKEIKRLDDIRIRKDL